MGWSHEHGVFHGRSPGKYNTLLDVVASSYFSKDHHSAYAQVTDEGFCPVVSESIPLMNVAYPEIASKSPWQNIRTNRIIR